MWRRDWWCSIQEAPHKHHLHTPLRPSPVSQPSVNMFTSGPATCKNNIRGNVIHANGSLALFPLPNCLCDSLWCLWSMSCFILMSLGLYKGLLGLLYDLFQYVTLLSCLHSYSSCFLIRFLLSLLYFITSLTKSSSYFFFPSFSFS